VVSRSVTRQLELKITDRRQLSKNVNAMVENCFSDCLFSRETFVSLMYTAILNRLKLQSFKVDYTRKIAKTQHIWPEASWQKPPRAPDPRFLESSHCAILSPDMKCSDEPFSR